MDFQVLHSEAISSIWTKTTHITMWVIFVILIGMIIAICVGYKLYKDKPEEPIRSSYVESERRNTDQTPNKDNQP